MKQFNDLQGGELAIDQHRNKYTVVDWGTFNQLMEKELEVDGDISGFAALKEACVDEHNCVIVKDNQGNFSVHLYGTVDGVYCPETVDVTPTWTSLISLMLEQWIDLNKRTSTQSTLVTRGNLRKEFEKMARAADRWIASKPTE